MCVLSCGSGVVGAWGGRAACWRVPCDAISVLLASQPEHRILTHRRLMAARISLVLLLLAAGAMELAAAAVVEK